MSEAPINHHWECDKPLDECKCQMYYDGIIEYTFKHFTDEAERYNKNGNNAFRTDWYCPGCGVLKTDRWSGGRPGSFCFSGFARGCQCGLWIWCQNEDESRFIRVENLGTFRKKVLRLMKSPSPKKPNGKYVCGCCDEMVPFKVGDRVQFYYACEGKAGIYEITGYYRQSQGHIIWNYKGSGHNSFGHSLKHHLVNRRT